ncbi:hypothetical protein ACTG9Q_22745 [Actinokineospora sp. 24-640]
MHDARPVPGSMAATAAGVDHVRLSYLYLDDDDSDAYASLVHADMLGDRPDCRGGRHDLHRLIADGDGVAVVGSFTGRTGRCQSFVDVFTLSPEGLLLAVRRFHAV